MCRIFGFKSIIDSQVHRSLMLSDNALARQSHRHPDGWGLAYYVAGAPHVIKNVNSAVEDQLFRQVSGVVSSQTVIAHIRKATQGGHSLLNTHPFQFGPWVFAHNGHIHEFPRHREDLLQLVSPNLRRFILGDTDSELLFFILLSEYFARHSALSQPSMAQMAEVIEVALAKIQQCIGGFERQDSPRLDCHYLSFLLSNGDLLLAHQGGKPLYFSTYKSRCSDRDHCASFSEICEAASSSGFVNHLLFSSEPLGGENIWQPLGPGELMGVDPSMKLWHRAH